MEFFIGITYIYFLNCEKIALGSTAESSNNICDKDGNYLSVTEIGVANFQFTNFQFNADYYSYKVICDCAQFPSIGSYTHDSFIGICS